jgi:SAM-dependent methyltransferase
MYCELMEQAQTELQNSYDRVAQEYAKQFYDELDSKPFDRKMLDWFIEKVDGLGTICDLGCGCGHIANYLHNRSLEVCGIDLSSGMLKQAQQLNPNITFQQGPSGRIVKDVVQRIMERTQAPNTYQVSEVCQILAKDNPELRGKGGCWGIVVRANNFSCTVKLWDGVYTVGLQYLKSYNYLPAECEQMQVICDACGSC